MDEQQRRGAAENCEQRRPGDCSGDDHDRDRPHGMGFDERRHAGEDDAGEDPDRRERAIDPDRSDATLA